MLRSAVLGLALAVSVSGCFSNGSSAGTTGVVPTGPPATIEPGSSTTTLDTRPCPQTTVLRPTEVSDGSLPTERLPAGNPHAAAVAASQAAFSCSSHVVVVGTDDLDLIAIATTLAAGLDAPLLFGEAGASSLLAYELDRLAPGRVWLVGDAAEAPAPEWSDVRRLTGDDAAISQQVSGLLALTEAQLLPAEPGFGTVITTFAALQRGRAVTPPVPPTTTVPAGAEAPSITTGTTTTSSITTTTSPAVTADATEAAIGSGVSGMVWIVDQSEPEAALAASASALASGGLVTIVDGSDLRLNPEAARSISQIEGGPRSLQVVGGSGDAGWQLQVLLRGDELPGGGFLMFPGRRLVALYGNPLTTALGLLGEQGSEESVARARQVAQGYDADGVPVVTAFDIITTVAAADAGADGNYSNEMEAALIREWVDVAARNDMYVVLDIQPGRSDFLTQVKLYEEFLLEPHVGVALDPEWRLGPDQFHLNQIGTVTAAEVNTVVDWLAELVRENALPQKLLLLHQFRVSMLQDRQDIRTPTELAVVIQMDGQGAINDKYATWGVITDGWEDFGWNYGWKNFFDEDIPGPITPADVLDLRPRIVYVSYQ